MSDRDTIFALASGPGPAAIAVVRVSGPQAVAALVALTGAAPPSPRRLVLRDIAACGVVIDRALVVRFAAPASATGEEAVEFHLHGGVAVVAALAAALTGFGARLARPGEFTRRAFDNGRLDLTQVEGLADLIAAETEAQRRAAHDGAAGVLGARVAGWQARLTALRAEVEAELDFAEGEEDVAARLGDTGDLAALIAEIAAERADAPRARALSSGLRIVVAGPPNVGKSSLVNALANSEVALTAPTPGTTRDAVSVRLDLGGVLVTLVDTAGVRVAADPVEAAGIARAASEAARADLVLAAFVDGAVPANGQPVRTMIDLDAAPAGWVEGVIGVSSRTGAGIGDLAAWLAEWARGIARPDEPAPLANARQRSALDAAWVDLCAAAQVADPVLRAEHLHTASRALGEISGRVGIEQVLDAIFSRFCIGK